MATRTKPLISAAALASAAAIVVASPAIAPSFTTASVPSPHALSTAQYDLTTVQTLLGLTAAGWQDAYFYGWKGGVTADNTWFPYSESSYPLYSANGLSGVFYLGLDALLNGTTSDFDTWTQNTLVNYYFELGASAAIQVALQETIGGINPLISNAITALFNVQSTISSTIVGLTSVIPSLNIGPVPVGAGILSSLYFYGQTPDGTFSYSSNGLSAIFAYVSAAVTVVPAASAAAALPAAAEAPSTRALTQSATSKAETVADSTTTAVSATANDTKPADSTPADSAPVSAPSKAEASKTEATGTSAPATESTPAAEAPASTPAAEAPASTPAAEAPASTPAADATDSAPAAAPAKAPRRPVRDAVEKATKQITSAISGSKAEKSGAASAGAADAGAADAGSADSSK